LSTNVGYALDEITVSRQEEGKSNSGVQVAARDVANRVGENHDGHTKSKGSVDTETGVDNDSTSQNRSLPLNGSVGIVGNLIVSTFSESTGTEGRETDGSTAPNEHKEHHSWKDFITEVDSAPIKVYLKFVKTSVALRMQRQKELTGLPALSAP
jgi:hypothetical protein